MAPQPTSVPMNDHESRPRPLLTWPDYLADGPIRLDSLVAGLDQSQHWQSDRVAGGRCRQLSVLCLWAVRQSPFHAQHEALALALVTAVDEPARFFRLWTKWPVLTKAELRTHNLAIHAAAAPPQHGPVEVLRTSGSTGIPVEVRTTALTRLLLDALSVREYRWQQRDPTRRFGVARHMPRAMRVPGGTTQLDWGPPVAQLFQTGPASIIHVGNPIDDIVEWLLKFDPHYLLTYPSVAAELFAQLNDRGIRPLSLVEVRSFSEPLDTALELQLQANWGVRCTDMYSANECGYIAFRCREHGTLHVQQETIHVEVLDEAGNVCGPGEEGRVVVTPLHNFATPLIRYELGDIAGIGESCACGRPGLVLTHVKGRVRNLIRTPDGRQYWPTGLGKLRTIAAIKQAQYVQTALDTIELRLVVECVLDEADQESVTSRAQEALGYPFKIEIRLVDAVERGPTGKFEEFLSRLSE